MGAIDRSMRREHVRDLIADLRECAAENEDERILGNIMKEEPPCGGMKTHGPEVSTHGLRQAR